MFLATPSDAVHKPDAAMPDADPILTSDEVLQRILGELRDFRKEFKKIYTREESARLPEPQAPAVPIGDENAPAKSNHPLPPLPLRIPEQTSSMPGQYPRDASVSQPSRWIKR